MEEGLYCLMFVTVEKSVNMFYILFFVLEIPFFPFLAVEFHVMLKKSTINTKIKIYSII